MSSMAKAGRESIQFFTTNDRGLSPHPMARPKAQICSNVNWEPTMAAGSSGRTGVCVTSGMIGSGRRGPGGSWERGQAYGPFDPVPSPHAAAGPPHQTGGKAGTQTRHRRMARRRIHASRHPGQDRTRLSEAGFGGRCSQPKPERPPQACFMAEATRWPRTTNRAPGSGGYGGISGKVARIQVQAWRQPMRPDRTVHHPSATISRTSLLRCARAGCSAECAHGFLSLLSLD